MQAEYGVIIHFIHISGTRMQELGVDGLSRGTVSEGIINNGDFFRYVPLALSALERSDTLKAWICDWWKGTEELQFLDPEGWFTQGHKHGAFVWTPAPAAAATVLDQLTTAVHKRPKNTHLFIVPRLMTGEWRKVLGKAADVVLTVGGIEGIWGRDQHEPLIMGIIFPLFDQCPWTFKNSKLMNEVPQEVVELCKTGGTGPTSLLAQLTTWSQIINQVSPEERMNILNSEAWKN